MTKPEIFEHQDCTRCGGEGRIITYSNVQGGVCFKCGGLKRILTAHGKRNYEAYKAAVDAVVTKPASELRPGMAVQLRDFRKYVPVASIETGIASSGHAISIVDGKYQCDESGNTIFVRDSVYIVKTAWPVTIDTHCMLGKYKTDTFEVPVTETVRIHQGDAMPKCADFVTVSRAAKSILQEVA